jgi:GT2 family glycosyltransferase
LKTSIIILTFNKLEYTKACIESIRMHTKPECYEIIVVDNHSTDGTVDWLRDQADLRVIYNEKNEGFPAGCNQGIKMAAGDNVLLLNNDTVVTRNWLDNLIQCLYSSEDIGAVGPVTNYCSYYQSIPVEYQSIEEMHAFAASYNQQAEKWESRLKLVGFCMLIKREVVENVALLDERFTPGNFEDDDYSLRIWQHGYKLKLCRNTFIHHAGSVSWKDDHSQFAQAFYGSNKKFEDKWGFNSGYSLLIRHEIIELMDSPKDKEIHVLDVGCACGATMLQIKNEYKNASLYGIELNKQAAAIASLFADVRSSNVEEELSYPLDYFDYVIFADVLEHLYNPWDVVKNIKKHLKKDGKILVSVPNVMHYSLLRELINGQWTYRESGLLDQTHIRFFTLYEIIKMFRLAGYHDLDCKTIILPKTTEDEQWIERLTQLSDVSGSAQFEAYQYIIKAHN